MKTPALKSSSTPVTELTGATGAGDKAYGSPRGYGLYYGSLELDAKAKVAGFTCRDFVVDYDKKTFKMTTRWTKSKATASDLQ